MQNYQVNPDTGEIIEVIQRMKEKHEYVDKEGTKWKRVFTSPGATIDTQVDVFSSKEFVYGNFSSFHLWIE